MAVVLWIIALVAALPLIYLALELACGLVAASNGAAPSLVKARTTILMPAHDEAQVISQTLRALKAAVTPDTEVVVVADNCTDDTAALARAAGVRVLERSHASAKGKGHALAFGRDDLRSDPPDVVLVLDADCSLRRGSDGLLASKVIETGQVAQATNLVVAGASASPLVQISNFAMLIKNVVRARGMEEIGGGVLLFGTGMAFPWDVFNRAPLASSAVVEDMELGIWLARSDLRVHLEEGALVTSAAAGLSDSAGQRRRWEHGFLKTAADNAFPLVWEAIRTRSRYKLAVGLHMLVPPLALLFLITGCVLLTLTLGAARWGIWGPATLVAVPCSAVVMLLLLAWALEGSEVLSVRGLAMVPVYAIWKIPIYAAFFIGRQTNWNRTRREGEGSPETNRTKS